MKYSLIILLYLINLINSKLPNLKDSKLKRKKTNYTVLTEAARKTFYQIYNISIDFRDRNEVIIDDSKKRLRVYVDEYDPLVPEENKISFFVNKGEPLIAEILNNMTNAFNNTNIESKYIINIFGDKYDIKEEFKILANMIAAGFDYGHVVIYKKKTETFYQTRYKCFIIDSTKKGIDGPIVGAFEIIQEDKDDKDTIEKAHANWWDSIKYFLKEGKEAIELIGGVVISILGVIEKSREVHDKLISFGFNISPSLLLMAILALFGF